MPEGLLSVTVATRDRPERLRRCLDSILAQGWPPARTEVLVVDDGGTPACASALRAYAADLRARGVGRVELVRNETSRNTVGARAQALALCDPTAEWILSVDDDALFEPGVLEGLRARRAPGIALLVPRIVRAAQPDVLDHGPCCVGRWTGRYRELNPPMTTDCDWANGTCWFLNAAVYRALGGLWTPFHASHWEADFCMRARRAGYRVLYVPEVRVLHDAPGVVFRPERLYYLYRNKLVLLRRNFPALRRLTALGLHVAVGLPRALLEALRRGDIARTAPLILAAFLDGLRGRTGPRRN
jgi:GT2 family glycosyltransferase